MLTDPFSPNIIGDFDDDGDVDGQDIATFATAWPEDDDLNLDLNNDGIVSLYDLEMLARHFGL